MKIVELNLTRNPKGTDPTVNFYTLLKEQFPKDNVLITNSKILSVYNYQSPYSKTMARVTIIKNDAPLNPLVYYVRRFDLRRYIKNPYFTTAELTAVKNYTNSFDLMTFIANKSNLNLTSDDLLVERSYIEYTGGSVTPNWLMKTREQSLWFYGQINLWLHR